MKKNKKKKKKKKKEKKEKKYLLTKEMQSHSCY